MAIDVRRMIEEARETMSGRRVFSEPYERNGVTVILASRVKGGGGGGGGEGEAPEADPNTKSRGKGSGWGGGFGVDARPVGAFVVHGDDVRFVPALDVTGMVLGAQLVAVGALLTIRTAVKARAAKRKS